MKSCYILVTDWTAKSASGLTAKSSSGFIILSEEAKDPRFYGDEIRGRPVEVTGTVIRSEELGAPTTSRLADGAPGAVHVGPYWGYFILNARARLLKD